MKSIISLLSVLLCLAPGVASAEFIDMGHYTVDTETGLDWLDVGEAGTFTWYGLKDELASGEGLGAEGWRYATQFEWREMVLNYYNRNWEFIQTFSTEYCYPGSQQNANFPATQDFILLFGGQGTRISGLLGSFSYSIGGTEAYAQSANVYDGSGQIGDSDRLCYGTPRPVRRPPSSLNNYTATEVEHSTHWLVRNTSYVVDSDGDGIQDVTDNCLEIINPDQTDTDGDGAGDACDTDDDADGVEDDLDNCPTSLGAGADQTDSDLDGIGDLCDLDLDGDGVSNNEDNCALVPNPFQTDTDTDGAGDSCDEDDDNDGVCDIDAAGAECVAGPDNCPTTMNVDQLDSPDADGIGNICDADDDNDGILDVDDNCPITLNVDQNDTDQDTRGDACDEDDDGDSIPDNADNCQFVFNTDQLDSDGDSIGDACNDANDSDGDEFADSLDNCSNTANSGQSDFDADSLGDACDPDVDGDGVANDADICALSELGNDVNPENGCSIEQLCPCSGPRGTTSSWKNHGRYLSCLAHAAKEFESQGLIDSNERANLISSAAQSTCGY